MDYEGSYAANFKSFVTASDYLGPTFDSSVESGSYRVEISWPDGSVIWLGSQASFYGSNGAANGLSLYYRLSDSECATYKTNLETAVNFIADVNPTETTFLVAATDLV